MQIPENWTPQDNSLTNHVILVTGAALGIGRAVSFALAAQGATIILLDKDIPGLNSIYDEIEQAGYPKPAIYPLNLEGASPTDYEALADKLKEEFGQLNGLLHNAAHLSALTPIEHIEVEEWYQTIQINLNGPLLLTQACLDLLKETKDSSVLFTSDSMATKGRAYWGAYGVAKAGIEGLSQMLADELEDNTTVSVNTINPGIVHTRLRVQAYPAEDSSSLAQPKDVVMPYIYLLGPDSKKNTGQKITGQHFEAQG